MSALLEAWTASWSNGWLNGWFNALLGFIHESQLALLHALHALGLTSDAHGQPAWPWSWRLSGENLLQDRATARRLAWSLLIVAAVLLALLLAVFWRRARTGLFALAALGLLLAPWPEWHVLQVAAHPTSFHQSPSGFSAASIVQGQALYHQHCANCHAPDGSGETALAQRLATWPPHFAGPLLWKRADGDLFWRVQHGMHNRRGERTMPGFAPDLSDAQTWAVLDYLKALGAGSSLRATGQWLLPVRLPDFAALCAPSAARSARSWEGQRLRLVALGEGESPPQEDPRLVTLLLTPRGGAVPEHCASNAADAWQALAVLLGQPADAIAGHQLMADREGWVRARGLPGQDGWTEGDLVCRSGAPAESSAASTQMASADGLDALIRRMDAEPVRFVKGGVVH